MEENHKVKVYSTEWCPACKMAKQFLDEHNIKYEYIDVEKDQEALKEMIEKSGQQGVPVIDIDGEMIVGFDKDTLVKKLDIKE